MGECAIYQMKRDFKSIAGFNADSDEFEIIGKMVTKNKCQLCGKRLANPKGLKDRLRDKTQKEINK